MLKPGYRSFAVVALLAVSCSSGDSPNSPLGSGPSSVPAVTTPGVPGLERGQGAVGDVQNGPIEIQLVRVAQANEPAFYAFAGGGYLVKARKETDVYVQIWSSSSTLAEPPRLVIEWGDGTRDNIHCGPCRLSHSFEREAPYLVTLSLDDRAGGVTRRSFTLDTRPPVTSPEPSPTPCTATTAFVGGLNGVSNSSIFEHGSEAFLPALGWATIAGSARAWDLASNGALFGGTQYGNYEVQYDTGVAIRANTTYTLTLDIGYMAALTGGNSTYRFEIGTLNGTTFTPLGSAVTGSAPYAGGMNGSVFAIPDAQQVIVSGSTVSGDRLAVRFAQVSSLGSPLSDHFGFDNVTLEARGCIVP